MKLVNFKQVLSRRRFLIYVVLLFACFLINYGVISNFLQATFAGLRNIDRAVEFSKETEIGLSSNLDLRVSKITVSGDNNNNGAELHANTTVPSDIALGQASISEYYDFGNQGKDIDSRVDKITSDILETLNKTFVNVTEPSYTTCNTTSVIGNSCEIGRCLQLQLPDDLRTRVEQVVTPQHLQINYKLRDFLTTMADKVPGYYDFILVSGVSYSHYEEAQAMLYNIHTHLFPYLTNFTFIYYNLGLSHEQRTFMAKICKCHLIDFPFERLPEFVGFLKCYSWKPLIVNAHIARANLLFWIDASVRFKNQSHKTIELLNRARVRGVQVFKSKQSIAHVTLPSLFHFFGDEACVYASRPVILSGVVLFRNEHFVKRAILEPWAACAISTKCMCPKNKNLRDIRVTCHNEAGLNQYGICHRFDQSALSLILTKIYQDRIGSILAPIKDYIEIKRSDKMQYPIARVRKPSL